MSLTEIHITTPEQVPLNYKVAGLGSRATAHILDWLILSISVFALFVGIGLVLNILPGYVSDFITSYGTALTAIGLFLLLWGYFLLFEFFAGGRTPGKMLVGIRVMQDNGQSLTFLTSAVRNLLRIIDFLPLLYLLGILMIFLHARHQRIGDLAAGTIVVYQRKFKGKKKKNHLEKEIERRLATNPIQLELDTWTIKKIGIREWKLLDTYIKRRSALKAKEQQEMAQQVAAILFPLLGMETANQPGETIENKLFALYQLLKEEWQY